MSFRGAQRREKKQIPRFARDDNRQHFFNKLLSFFSYVLFLQRFDFGQETASAQASLVVGRHGDFWQFSAPATGFLLAGHRGAALCAEFFHQVMMAQLWCGVQRSTYA
jgi:hypothetical protein